MQHSIKTVKTITLTYTALECEGIANGVRRRAVQQVLRILGRRLESSLSQQTTLQIVEAMNQFALPTGSDIEVAFPVHDELPEQVVIDILTVVCGKPSVTESEWHNAIEGVRVSVHVVDPTGGILSVFDSGESTTVRDNMTGDHVYFRDLWM